MINCRLDSWFWKEAALKRELFLLRKAEMAGVSRHFPLSHGVLRVDDRRVVSGIIHVVLNGLQWKDATKRYGPHKTVVDLH